MSATFWLIVSGLSSCAVGIILGWAWNRCEVNSLHRKLKGLALRNVELQAQVAASFRASADLGAGNEEQT